MGRLSVYFRSNRVNTLWGSALLSQGQIVEHTENDRYWGDGGDGSGKNRLGQILMRVREELRGQSSDGRAV
jgi:predicted NAD-dependent protein-ADP-ribosyltransferase YbiA (DUF1768 family)